jgi:hypothetical protein
MKVFASRRNNAHWRTEYLQANPSHTQTVARHIHRPVTVTISVTRIVIIQLPTLLCHLGRDGITRAGRAAYKRPYLTTLTSYSP